MKFFKRSVSTPDVASLKTEANIKTQDMTASVKQEQSLKSKNDKTEHWEHCRDLVESLEKFASIARKQHPSGIDLNYEAIDRLSSQTQGILHRLVYFESVGSPSYEMQIRILKAIKEISRSNLVLNFLLSDVTSNKKPSLFDQWLIVFISIVKYSCEDQANFYYQGHRDKTSSAWWASRELCWELILDILKLNEPQATPKPLVKSCHKDELIELCSEYCKILNSDGTKIVTVQAMSSAMMCIIEISKEILPLKDRIDIIKKIVLPIKRLECLFSADWKSGWSPVRYNDPYNLASIKRYTVHQVVHSSGTYVDEILVSLCSDQTSLTKTLQFLEEIMQIDLAKQKPETRSACIRLLSKLECKIEIHKRLDYREYIISQYVVPMLKSSCKSCVKYNACWIISQDPYPNLCSVSHYSHKSWNRCMKRLIKLVHNDPDINVKSQAQIALANLTWNRSESNSKLAIKWKSECNLQVSLTLASLLKPRDEVRIADLFKNYLHLSNRVELVTRLYSMYRKQSLNVMLKYLEVLSEYLVLSLRHQEHRQVPPHPHVPVSILKLMTSLVSDATQECNNLLLTDIEVIILESVKTALNHNGRISVHLRGVALELLATLTGKFVSKQSLNCLEQLQTILFKFQKTSSDLFISIAPILYNLITVEPKLLHINVDYMNRLIRICMSTMKDSESFDDRALAIKLLEITLIENDDNVTSKRCCFDNLQIVDLACSLLVNEYLHWRIDYESNDPFRNQIISKSRQNYRSQLMILVCASFGSDLHKTLEIFGKIEAKKKLDKGWILELLVHFLLEPSNEWSEDYYWPQHESRIMIRALCAIIRLPNNRRPPSLEPRSKQLLPKIISHFESLHRMYEEHFKELGSTMRIKYDESIYLNWEPERAGFLRSKLEHELGFQSEIATISGSLSEAQQSDNVWYRVLSQSLTRSQLLLLKDLIKYQQAEPVKITNNLLTRIGSLRRSRIFRKNEST